MSHSGVGSESGCRLLASTTVACIRAFQSTSTLYLQNLVSCGTFVSLVGVVEHVSRRLVTLEFGLNDGFGRIRVRHYITSDGSCPEYLPHGTYVSAIGPLRHLPEPHLNAYFVRNVTADEISLHVIEVAHVFLMPHRC